MAVLGLFCSWAFCSCCEVGLLLLQWAGFLLQWLLLCCGAQTLGMQASIFVVRSFVVLWHVNPEPGIKPMSPSLARGVLATGPPGLPNTYSFSISFSFPFLGERLRNVCSSPLPIFKLSSRTIYTLDTC